MKQVGQGVVEITARQINLELLRAFEDIAVGIAQRNVGLVVAQVYLAAHAMYLRPGEAIDGIQVSDMMECIQ
jgi:hypothetical protein